jgi:Cu-processing system ATP-binding protein
VQELREAVDLPLVIRLRLQCSRETLAAALQGVALEQLTVEGSAAEVRCHRSRKMELLRRLGELGAVIDDITVREPSLEDVFLGYAS